MKGLITQLAGQEPSLQRQERRKSEREEDENVRIWLFYFGRALPRPCYAAAVNAPVKTNQGCQGRFCLVHTPRLHLYTQTQTCAVFLYRPLRFGLCGLSLSLSRRWVMREACGGVQPHRRAERSSTCFCRLDFLMWTQTQIIRS